MISRFIKIVETVYFKTDIDTKRSRKYSFLFLFLSFILAIYVLFGSLIIKNEPLNIFFLNINTKFISFIFSIATSVSSNFGIETYSESLSIYLNNKLIFNSVSGYKAYRWVLLVLILFWFSPAGIRKKLLFTGFTIILTIFTYLAKTVLWITLFELWVEDMFDAIKSAHVVIHLTYYLIICLWVYVNKTEFDRLIDQLKLNILFLFRKNVLSLFYLFLFVIFFNNVGMALLKFNYFISFIFSITQYVLAVLNYESIIDGALLIGTNGSIYMAKFCLGINTMIVFSSIIWFTGKKILPRLIYIISGVIFINIMNVIRFVSLFIYLQNHESYELAMDFHDIFDYVIYILIFVMWIIWFEKFSDVWEDFPQKANAQIILNE